MNRVLERISDWCWRDVPEALGRWSSTLGDVAADGGYLGSVPLVGAFVPLGAFALGIVEGWNHFKPPVDTIAGHALGTGDALLFTYTISVMVTLAVVAGLGAGVGVWLWLGYVGGDLFGYQLFGGTGSSRSVDLLIISYVLLAVLLIVIPFVTVTARRQFAPLTRRLGSLSVVPDLVLAVVVAGLLAYAWTRAVPTLTRPLNGFDPNKGAGAGNDDAFIPLTRMASDVVRPVAIVAGARVALEWLLGLVAGRTRWVRAVPPAPVVPQRSPVLLPLSILTKAALGTVLLEGIYESRDDALTAFLVMLGILVVRAGIGYVRPWVRVMNLIPTAVRILVGALVALLVARVALGSNGEDASSFGDLLTPVLVGIGLMSLLLPGHGRKRQVTA